MGWADSAIEWLRLGKPVTLKPKGRSMEPKIKHGNIVTVSPIQDPASLTKGDIVLVTVNGNQYLHLISATDKTRVQISNNKGHVNGWVSRKSVHGILTDIAVV